MDKKNLNQCRISGITDLTSAEKTANDLKIAEKKIAITTQVDTNEADFITCAFCGGKILKASLEVYGGVNSNNLSDVAGTLNVGNPTDLGKNNHCPHCGEDPINPVRSDVAKFNYGNGRTELST